MYIINSIKLNTLPTKYSFFLFLSCLDSFFASGTVRLDRLLLKDNSLFTNLKVVLSKTGLSSAACSPSTNLRRVSSSSSGFPADLSKVLFFQLSKRKNSGFSSPRYPSDLGALLLKICQNNIILNTNTFYF